MADWIGNALVIVTFLVSLAFCVVYHLKARWWENEFGKSLMTYQLAITGVLGLAIPRIFMGSDNIVYMILRIFVFTCVPVALAWRLSVLIKVQSRRARKENHE